MNVKIKYIIKINKYIIKINKRKHEATIMYRLKTVLDEYIYTMNVY